MAVIFAPRQPLNFQKENVNDHSNKKTIWTMKEIQAKYDAERKEAEVLADGSHHDDSMIENIMTPIKEEKTDVGKYANEYGIIETVDTDLTCKMCLHGFKQKFRFERHSKQDCLSICQWKDEDDDHEHDWVNISFVNEEDARNYARDKLDAEFLYSMRMANMPDGSAGNAKNIIYTCRPYIKGTNCKAQLRIRKSKRYVSENILVPVFELIGCAHHTHDLEYRY